MSVLPERRIGTSRGAEEGRAWGGGVPLPTGGGVWEGGCAVLTKYVLVILSSEFFFDFLTENGEFWCILGGASALYVI